MFHREIQRESCVQFLNVSIGQTKLYEKQRKIVRETP